MKVLKLFWWIFAKEFGIMIKIGEVWPVEMGELLRQARLEAGLTQRELCGERITRNMLSQRSEEHTSELQSQR